MHQQSAYQGYEKTSISSTFIPGNHSSKDKLLCQKLFCWKAPIKAKHTEKIRCKCLNCDNMHLIVQHNARLNKIQKNLKKLTFR